MALLRTKQKSDKLVVLRDDLTALLNPAKSTFSNVSNEAFGAFGETSKANLVAGAVSDVAAQLEPSFTTAFEHMVAGEVAGFGGKAFTEQQINAAALIATASANSAAAMAYHKAAMSTAVASEEGVTVIQPSNNPAFNYSTDASFEAFDARNLEELRSFNTIFAFSAAIQDEFSEAFFPTVTLSPDATGLEVSIRRTMVQQEIRHPLTGEVVDWKQRNLLDAVTDYTILINEATRIYPQVIVGNAESEKHFVDKAIIPPVPALGAQGVRIQSAPLKAGVKVGLLGAGANERTNGQPDQTDAIDHAVKVEGAYFRVTTGSGTSIIRVNTKSFAQNGFLKAFEGRDRRIALDFPTRAIALTANTTDFITGAPATALAFLGAAPYENVQVNLETHITGDGNLQLGWVRVNASTPEVVAARIVNGPNDYDSITDAATLADIRAQFTDIEFLGYDIKAYYANTNKRFLGLLLDSVEERVRYVVPLSPPISVQTPITGTSTATDMAGPMNAQRIVNSLNAVTKILENVEILREVSAQIGYGSPTDEAVEIEGFGRIMVRPALYDDVLNIADVLSSPSTSNRTQDVQAAIVNKIRYGVAHIYTESRLQPAIDSINGTAGEKPKVVIGTDPKTASYIMVNGDPRILGLGFETQVVVSYDYRFRSKIYASFVRKVSGDVDVLSHGAFAYIPELVTQAQYPINGSTTNVTQVQNRNLHVVFLPVALYIEVQGLAQAASDLVELPVRL
jgi:hypothetical protein